MNCSAAQHFLSADRADALASDPSQGAALTAHLAGCAACRRFQSNLSQGLEGWKKQVAMIETPDVERAWQDIRREIRLSTPEPRRRAYGLGRWALPLGAAAVLAVLSAVAPRWFNPSGPAMIPMVEAAARADFVEVPNDASSMVYVDDRSGWLVVWAVDEAKPAAAQGSGK
jgi:hypothetical protein